jgi:hypothetical protein
MPVMAAASACRCAELADRGSFPAVLRALARVGSARADLVPQLRAPTVSGAVARAAARRRRLDMRGLGSPRNRSSHATVSTGTGKQEPSDRDRNLP